MTVTDALPSGNVAFLFTDIEGSTARWDADRAAMQEALRRHDAIVRAAIEAHGGHVFKTIGDAFCAAFERVPDALSAALAAQRELGSQDWHAVDGLLVRMAVHAGDADERDGDYFGPAVNRVARLLSAGHGGQVLVSGLAADEGAPHLAVDTGLRSLGMLQLRGFRQAERVFQLTAPGLRSAFKPLHALETPPNNLPRQLTSFVGRQADVTGVEALLRANSLVTIVGTGGVGKTRLAVEAASDVLEDTRDGAWFVDLAPLSDPALVASAMLSALGADQTSDTPAIDILLGHLGQRELLLVLDNCEHLVGDVARIVSAILAHCRHVTILATSREPLNVAGEQLLRLSSLGTADAVELFAERAQTVNPVFRIGGTNRAAVEDLCTRLDGIALAIELAAARMRAVSVEELLRRLQLRVLTGGPRDRQPRQQTMRALIDWSYELLNEEERSLFRDVSVFAGGFTLDAAAAVHTAGDDESFDTLATLDHITSLVDKSLIAVESRDAGDRYRLLEPIREYARERLDQSGKTQDVLSRHARAFAEIADRAYAEFDTAPSPDWLARNKLELDNLRAALDWTLGHEYALETGGVLAGSAGPIFMRLSLLREGIGWGERALQFASQLTPGVCARINYALSMLYHNQLAYASALAAARESAELYRKAGDERGLARALSQVAHHLSDSFDHASEAGEEAVNRARALDDPRLLAAVLQRCAFAYAGRAIEKARGYIAESVMLFRSLGRDDETARALALWADAEAAAGNHERAISLALEALDIGTKDGRLYVVLLLASLYVVAGGGSRAEQAAFEALHLASATAHSAAVGLAILYIAALRAQSDPALAARLSGYAEKQLESLGWHLFGSDRVLEGRLKDVLQEQLSPGEVAMHRETGAAWTEATAVSAAVRA
jgi:predicted ATPase/class 3 adenylate cyclase